jgi:hypothetical protein
MLTAFTSAGTAPTTADVITAYATTASAIATTITAIVIAFQTYATRQSVAVSQAMAIEAAQARLDESAPRIQVWTSIYLPLGRGESGYYQGTSVEYLREVSKTREYSLPNDKDLIVWIKITTFVTNRGTEPARVRLEEVGPSSKLSSVRVEIAKDSRGSLQVLPTGDLTLEWAVGQTVEDWATQSKLNITIVNLRADDERDNGVIDTWPLQVTADCLVLVASGRLGWPSFPVVRTLPRRREYFLSKIDSEPLIPTRRAGVRSRLYRFGTR